MISHAMFDKGKFEGSFEIGILFVGNIWKGDPVFNALLALQGLLIRSINTVLFLSRKWRPKAMSSSLVF